MVSTRPMPLNDNFAVPGYSHDYHQTPLRRPAMTSYYGRDDTLALTGPVGAGDNGYMGRDIGNPASMRHPYNATPGMFRRLHEGAGR